MNDQEIMSFLNGLKRPTFFPQITMEPTRTGSRYFGAPWMEEGREWPLYDGEPMCFILQLDLSSLPELPGMPRTGLLSYFRGTGWEEDQSNIALLWQDTAKPGGLRVVPGDVFSSDARAITGWVQGWDIPHHEDLWEIARAADIPLEDLERVTDEIVSDTEGEVLTEDGEEMPEITAILTGVTPPAHCYMSDKLGGWPDWAQGPEKPCGDAVLVMQISQVFSPAANAFAESDCTVIGVAHIWFSPSQNRFLHDWACD